MRTRGKTCDYCRLSWKDLRKSEYAGIKFKNVKALWLGGYDFNVYADSVYVVTIHGACCAWAAKERAIGEVGVEPFKKIGA